MDDLISRQAALALAKDICVPCKDHTAYRHRCIGLQLLMELPIVQPKIIRCKDCKHWRSGDGAFGRCYVIHEDEEIGTYKTMMECFAEDFCSWAERREK